MNSPQSTSTHEAKVSAAHYASKLIQNGMHIGLGTGSTASLFIQFLIDEVRNGLNIKTVATSNHSMELAKKGRIPLLEINEITTLDMTVDGADEVDPQKRMIKGRGGALLREKIIATMSKKMIVIIDDSKLVDQLGYAPLPVEIVPFGYPATIFQLQKLGYNGKLRKGKQEAFYITDNGNYIFDIQFSKPLSNPEEEHQKILAIAGVVETGFFFELAPQIIIGHQNGHVEIRR